MSSNGRVGLSPERANVQNVALQTLIGLPVADAIGVACSYLLHCAYNHKVELRRVLNERVIREGFSGISLLELLKRVSR